MLLTKPYLFDKSFPLNAGCANVGQFWYIAKIANPLEKILNPLLMNIGLLKYFFLVLKYYLFFSKKLWKFQSRVSSEKKHAMLRYFGKSQTQS